MPRPSGLARLASAALVSFVAATSLGSTGCIKAMILKGQIEGTRKGSAGMNTTADYEIARSASAAGIAQFEGMHMLAPDNEDAYYLLIKNYSSYAFAFAEDDIEQAKLAGDDDLTDYHKARAKSLYTRAIGYGFQWMEMKHEGSVAAQVNDESMKAYLAKFDDKADAQMLFWIGQAWAGRVSARALPQAPERGPRRRGSAPRGAPHQRDRQAPRASLRLREVDEGRRAAGLRLGSLSRERIPRFT
jgi:hypothetical protein